MNCLRFKATFIVPTAVQHLVSRQTNGIFSNKIVQKIILHVAHQNNINKFKKRSYTDNNEHFF